MLERPITHRGTIYPWQCDHMGHMNVMWYAGKFDEASWQLMSLLGLTRERLLLSRTGMAAIEQTTRYKRELHAGDLITVRTVVLEVKQKTFRMFHEMLNDVTGEIAAECEIVAVHFHLDQQKSLPLPEEVRQRAAALVPDEALELCVS